MNRKELLLFLKDKISSYDYDNLYLWTKNVSKRLFFFNSKFYCELRSNFYHVEYVSTGAYLGDGYVIVKNYERI